MCYITYTTTKVKEYPGADDQNFIPLLSGTTEQEMYKTPTVYCTSEKLINWQSARIW